MLWLQVLLQCWQDGSCLGKFWLCHHEIKSNYFWHCTSLFYIFSSARATFKFCGRSTSQPITETLALFSIRSVLGWQAHAYVFMRNGLISYCQHVGLRMWVMSALFVLAVNPVVKHILVRCRGNPCDTAWCTSRIAQRRICYAAKGFLYLERIVV